MPAASPCVTPYPLAMVLCDAIWQDPATGKSVLLGLFSALSTHEFPAVHPSMAIYVALTDGQGVVPIFLRLINAEDESVITEAKSEITCPNRLTVMECFLVIQKLVFPRPGEYRFQLFANGEFLMERRLIVIKGNSHEPDQGPDNP